jgi:hypothetical protein
MRPHEAIEVAATDGQRSKIPRNMRVAAREGRSFWGALLGPKKRLRHYMQHVQPSKDCDERPEHNPLSRIPVRDELHAACCIARGRFEDFIFNLFYLAKRIDFSASILSLREYCYICVVRFFATLFYKTCLQLKWR